MNVNECALTNIYYYRLRALVAKRDWNEIEEIAKSRKSPIGWEVSVSFPLLPSPSRLRTYIGIH